MNQKSNEPSELEMKLASNAIDALMQSLNLGMSTQQLQEFKQQTIADAQAVANEWELKSCRLSDTEEN
ncbi:MAG: hypothetical protein AAFW67_08985 [Cyanobacteria bacterium J06638_38]